MEVVILISDKITFKTKSTRKDKERHYITIIKVSTQKEDNIFVNIYAPNRGASKYIKQILRYKEKNRHEYNDSSRL